MSPKLTKFMNGDGLNEDMIRKRKMLSATARQAALRASKNKAKEKQKSPKPVKEGKKPRVWDLAGSADMGELDRTKDKPSDDLNFNPDTAVSSAFHIHYKLNLPQITVKISNFFELLDGWSNGGFNQRY